MIYHYEPSSAILPTMINHYSTWSIILPTVTNHYLHYILTVNRLIPGKPAGGACRYYHGHERFLVLWEPSHRLASSQLALSLVMFTNLPTIAMTIVMFTNLPNIVLYKHLVMFTNLPTYYKVILMCWSSCTNHKCSMLIITVNPYQSLPTILDRY